MSTLDPEVAREIGAWANVFTDSLPNSMLGPEGEAATIVGRVLAWAAKLATAGQNPADVVEALKDPAPSLDLIERQWQEAIDKKPGGG